ncbi:Thg1 C terminal domain-containing protein [Dipodascopsis uninucleata]
MAKSRFEYVRDYEHDRILLPNTFAVVRLDGRGFHRFSARYKFRKPNDKRALSLMNTAALNTMKQIPDVLLAYGQSDEYSFVLRRECVLFDRRESKIVSTFCSTFTAHYQFAWKEFFPEVELEVDMLPSFDSRVILYPTLEVLRDYLSWRQADCHINNLYNTSFWALVLKGNISEVQAESELKGTNSSEKNELLFSRFDINYNKEDVMFRKGTVLVRDLNSRTVETNNSTSGIELSKRQIEREEKKRRKASIVELHEDIIGDRFWTSGLGRYIH